MTTQSTKIFGVLLLEEAPFQDSRGVFEVGWEAASFREAGVQFRPHSACHSYNLRLHTLRGMHYQAPPFGQAKLVSCVRGRIWDVALDLRPDSPTCKQWHGETLEAASGRAVFIPAGCAHGFVTLQEDTVVAYVIEGAYERDATRVVRWNDPLFKIAWPVADPLLSEKDRLAPDFIL